MAFKLTNLLNITWEIFSQSLSAGEKRGEGQTSFLKLN
jgi:hypothetical protein